MLERDEGIIATHTVDCFANTLNKRVLTRKIPDKRFLIGIAGYSAIGKTTLAQTLAATLPSASIVQTDSFMLPRNHKRQEEIATGEDPRAIDFAALAETVEALLRGETREVPEYDHSVGEHRTTREIQPADFLIVEGSTSLYPQLDVSYDLAIFMDADWETEYKHHRDVATTERGYTQERFDELWPLFLEGYKRYLKPTKPRADIVCVVDMDRKFQSDSITVCAC